MGKTNNDLDKAVQETLARAAGNSVIDTAIKEQQSYRTEKQQPVIQQNITVQTKSGVFHVRRHEGSCRGDRIEESTKFFANKKSLMLYVSETEAIIFRERMFFTEDERIKEFIREHPMFNIEVWENEMPDYFVQELNDRQRTITRDPNTYEK